MSSGAGRRGGGVGDEAAVDGVGDATLEAAKCFSAAFTFALFAVEVVPAGMISAGLSNCDDVKGPVESSITAAVKAMALCSPGRGRNWCAAVGCGELSLGGESADVTHLTKNARRQEYTNPVNLGQRGPGIGHHGTQASLQGADFGVQLGQAIEPLADQLRPD